METILVFFARYILYARFILVGSAGVLVQTGVFEYMTQVLGRWYMEGVVFGFFASTLVMFLIEKTWVFHDRSHDHTRKEFGLFLIVTLAGLGETMLIMYGLVDVLHVAHFIAQPSTAIFVLSTTYPLNRRITFRKRQ